jgi:thiamine-phosphate pyrophosphorylase
MTQLCLTISLREPAPTLGQGRDAVAAMPVAAAIIGGAGDATWTEETVRPWVDLVQAAGAAALICDDPGLAKATRADGVHLSWGADLAERYAQARTMLGSGAIVGVDAGVSRHDAMTLGEAGADYIAFGSDDSGASPAERNALLAWWAEIFEVPVMALNVSDAVEARELADGMIDFAAVAMVPEAGRSEIAAAVLLRPAREPAA